MDKMIFSCKNKLILLDKYTIEIGNNNGKKKVKFMHDSPFQMTPYLPGMDHELLDLAVMVIKESARLTGSLHPITCKSLVDFLRIINSYYSNLIEGHKTHPIDIEKAMGKNYADDPVKRDLQIESEIHVYLEREIEDETDLDSIRVTSPDFIKSIHGRFYNQLPKRLRTVNNPDTNEAVEVEPGQFRNHEVQVGKHIPPRHDSLPAFLTTFDQIYNPAKFSGVQKLIAIAAAHHRLMWIHPFSDGNGRVARLFTGACMKKAQIDGYGIWSVNRGFGRSKKDYLTALSVADFVRQGDYDGRGNLSQKGLNRFCHFFLTICLDQVTFMSSLLLLNNFLNRIEKFIELRSGNLIQGMAPIKKEAFYLLKEAVLCGEFPRGKTMQLTGLKERTARNLLKQLTDEGILVSDIPKGPVRLGIKANLLPFWFPSLVESGHPSINRMGT